MSADQGYINACIFMGKLYSSGYGLNLDITFSIKKDYIKAVKYYKIAIDKGLIDGKQLLIGVLNLIKDDIELMCTLCSRYVDYDKMSEENKELRTLVDESVQQEMVVTI